MGSCLGDSKGSHKNQLKTLQIGKYKISVEKKISQGAYGDIWKCKNVNSGSIYAAKEIKLQNEELERMYKKQVRLLEKLKKSGRVINFIGSTQIKGDSYSTGIILMDFYRMTLLDKLKNGRLSLLEIVAIIQELLLALQEIHAQNCIHLDIKPENILIDTSKESQEKYRICDFGSCIEGPMQIKGISKAEKASFKEYVQANSTMIYRAPELIDIEGMTEVIDSKADIWMVGCIAYLMLYKQHPFETDGALSIMTGCHHYPEPSQRLNGQEKDYHKCLVELITKMLTVKQKERGSQGQLLEYIQTNFDFN